MLNALRHQRFGTADNFKASLPVISCSTPYGIRGLARLRTNDSRPSAIVLNALRHQRFGTNKPKRTPNHPTVLNALRHQRFGTQGTLKAISTITCAQRLTASEVWHFDWTTVLMQEF